MNVSSEIIKKKDSTIANSVILLIKVNKNRKFRIHKISFSGNSAIKKQKLKRTLKNTKEKKLYHILKASKYIETEYKNDKQKIIDKYNELGFRDAKIVKDTVYKYNSHLVNIGITIDEGRKYYIRNINWIGNTKFTSEELD